MSVPVLLLVRHGQASFGAADYDVLSDLGRRQADLAGAELRRRGLRDPLVVTGTLRRQVDTAALLGLAAEPTVDPRWDEYDHVGLVERYLPGETPDGTSRGLQVLLDVALVRWQADPEGGWATFSAGAGAALLEVSARASALRRDAVVVSSGGVLAAVCAQLLGAGDALVVPLNRVAVNTGISKVVVGSTGPTLVSVNEHGHLDVVGRDLVTYR